MRDKMTITDKDPWTGKEILRFPSFGKYNLHTYYSKKAFSPDGNLIAISTPHDTGKELIRGMEVLGTVRLVRFPEGEVYMTINDVPVPMHGGTFEFSGKAGFFALQLGENEAGLVHLDSKRIYSFPIKGKLKSFGDDGNTFIVISTADDGLWFYRLDVEGKVLEDRPLALLTDLDKISPIDHSRGKGLHIIIGNEKLSDSGKYFMFVRRIADENKKMFTKQLILVDLQTKDITILKEGDISKYVKVEGSFHHAAWIYGKDKILLHDLKEGETRLTFKVLDIEKGTAEIIFPVFGAKGHHTVMDQDEKIMITDSYSGDLEGVVSALDLEKGTIHPLAAWKLDEKKVEGHPSLSPDRKWVLYDCDLPEGSEVRAIKLEL